MATKRSRLESGRERASELVAAVRRELRTARILANISQDALAAQLGWSQSRYSEFERNKRPLAVEDLCVVAALLGLQPSIALHRLDEGLRDRGQIKLMQRLKALLITAVAHKRGGVVPKSVRPALMGRPAQAGRVSRRR